MEIRRAISQGANWILSLGHVPALLELIDEQQIPVAIRLVQGFSKVDLSTGTVFCRRQASCWMLEASGNSIQINLDRLQGARVVSRAAGAERRISLQLISESGEAWLTITGPAVEEGLAGQIWRTVMDSLLSDHARGRAPEAPAAVLPVHHAGEAAKSSSWSPHFEWTWADVRHDFAGMRLA